MEELSGGEAVAGVIARPPVPTPQAPPPPRAELVLGKPEKGGHSSRATREELEKGLQSPTPAGKEGRVAFL